MSRSQIEEIKEKLDILSVASEYLGTMKKSGANHFTRCPFHNEKTPSFAVNPDLGIYKCFGCGESGDVISFIQKMEGVEFPEALEIAAKRVGVKLEKKYSPQDVKLQKKRQELLQVNALVSEYFHYILTKHEKGERGRTYAKKRSITKELIDLFKVGYATRSFTNLSKYLKKKGYNIKDMIAWGFTVSRNGRIYDKFRSRLIFPLENQHSEVVGFSGRSIIIYSKAPKYLHSPTTLVFDKSKFLFGLLQAKKYVRKKGYCVICEGAIDVVSSHKTSVKNIVASLGTSINEQQLVLLKRYTDEVYLCFDNDLAGEKALLRASDIAHKVPLHVKAITLPKGKDADELINHDKKAWQEAVENAQPILDHMILRLSKRIDLSELRGKEEFISIIMPLIASLPKNIEQMYYLHRIAIILNVEETVLKEELESVKNSSNITAQVKSEKYRNIFKAPSMAKEEYLLMLILHHEKFLNISFDHISEKYFTTPAARNLYQKLCKYKTKIKRFSMKKFSKTLEDHERVFLEQLLLRDLEEYFEIESDYIKEIQRLQNYLKRNFYRSKIQSIKSEIQKAEMTKDERRVEKLMDKLLTLTKKLKSSE